VISVIYSESLVLVPFVSFLDGSAVGSLLSVAVSRSRVRSRRLGVAAHKDVAVAFSPLVSFLLLSAP
jgi:hypothetical protein